MAAIDLAYRHGGHTSVTGEVEPAGGGGVATPYFSRSAATDALILAPAIEYNWSSLAGVIGGVRVIQAGRAGGHSVTPVIAVNLVH